MNVFGILSIINKIRFIIKGIKYLQQNSFVTQIFLLSEYVFTKRI